MSISYGQQNQIAFAFARLLAKLDERARAHARVNTEWRLALAYDDARNRVVALHQEIGVILGGGGPICEACHGLGSGLGSQGNLVPCPLCRPEGT